MGDLKELDLAKISELTTGGASHFKQEVEDLDPTLQDLRSLKEAEAAGKNREEVLEFLDRQINAENAAAYLGIAENDIGELNDILNEIDRLEDLDHFDGEKIDIDQDKLIDLLGGTVSEMKEFVKNNSLRTEQLEDILSAEKRIKDRKTAKNFLEKYVKRSRVSEDVSEARKDLKNLKKDIDSLKEDESAEGEMPVNTESDSEDSEETNDLEEDDSNENEESEEDSENASENEKEDSEEDESSEADEKKKIADELGLEVSDEELEAFSLEDLKKIQSEKNHREDLIDQLSEEGLDEEELRNSSTSDLEKVAESIDKKEGSQEEHEEMREEAEEDLEMLMGAVRWDQEEEKDTGKNTKEKIEDLKQNIKDMFDRSGSKEGEKASGINADRVQEVLDQYRKLNDEEASIKTAHIMKGFLEQSLEIEREMTYKEIAENMPTDDESMEKLSEFFLKMHREQYTGKFKVDNSDTVIDTCEDVIDRLS